MNFNYKKARNLMVENQLKPNKIKEKNILTLFNNTPKENYLPENLKSICYSDKNFKILENRGYLKNLHMAQIIHNAKISSNDHVLHIGGLTGYLSTIIANLCKKLIIIEQDSKILIELQSNLKNLNISNVHIYNSPLEKGYISNSPYDLIIIDCPMYNLNMNLIDQLNEDNGRMVYIKKIKDDLSKAYILTKNKKNYYKEYLFDVFSEFSIDKLNSNFRF